MSTWDLAIVGAGPAGAATALGALRVDPSLRVAMLDRSTFPRDKVCGDGIAPHVIGLLHAAGVTSLVDDRTPVSRLRLCREGQSVDGVMRRSTWVIPRAEFDVRLVDAARDAGAVLLHERVRTVRAGRVLGLGDRHQAHVLVGADGAHSVVRRELGIASGPMAVAVRGYAPTLPQHRAAQVIVFDAARQPAYAWSFDRGDGLSNVGYGVVVAPRSQRPTKAHLLARLEALLPGSTEVETRWRGHPLPLSSGRWRPPPGPVLLAGDAAGLVNPMTGEGIFYAVATGLAAGRAAAEALVAGDPSAAGARYAAAVRPLLDTHLRHIHLAGRLCRHAAVLDAGLRAADADQRVFDDLVELGLARGRITPRLVTGLAYRLARPRTRRPTPASATHEETTPCES